MIINLLTYCVHNSVYVTYIMKPHGLPSDLQVDPGPSGKHGDSDKGIYSFKNLNNNYQNYIPSNKVKLR